MFDALAAQRRGGGGGRDPARQDRRRPRHRLRQEGAATTSRSCATCALFHGLGCPLLVGVSRKSFIGRLSAGEAPKARLPGSLAAGLHALGEGAHILRVHDVAETRQALAMWRGIRDPAGETAR